MELSTARYPVFDGHNDMVHDLSAGKRSFFERSTEGHIDLPRAREGGLAGGFCALFARPAPEDPAQPEEDDPDRIAEIARYARPLDRPQALGQTAALLGTLVALELADPAAVRIVRSAAEIEACLGEGVFAMVIHLEGAEAIDLELRALESLHRVGLRSLGLVWSRPNAFGQGVPFEHGRSPDTGPGLTDAGRDLVRACNALRVMIDLSHLNEQGFWDVARLSDAPLVATHSNAWALCPSTRNLTDRQLEAITASDGMVGLNFCTRFLRPDGEAEPAPPLSLLVDHIDYLVERLGIDRVGFGSDFDGARIPPDIGDAAGLPRLIGALAERGYDDVALRKLTHENWIRVLHRTWGA